METAIVRFYHMKRHKLVDLEIPLDISADDLIYALDVAYSLGIEGGLEERECFMVCEQPTALIYGDVTLRSLGVRNGSLLRYTQ